VSSWDVALSSGAQWRGLAWEELGVIALSGNLSFVIFLRKRALIDKINSFELLFKMYVC
jgi:hypothetical protein